MNKLKRSSREINPDEIFADSSNIPQFDTHQFEGRLDKPISRINLAVLAAFFLLVLITFAVRAWNLQVKNGAQYTQQSANNRLRHTPLFAPRGVIYDRNGVPLAWNAPDQVATTTADGGGLTLASTTVSDPDQEVGIRKYIDLPGLSHVLGYVQYPSKDSAGFYYQEDFKGVDGAEQYFNDELQGKNGLRLIEVDAQGKVQSENTVEPPVPGQNITLSIDSRVQSEMYKAIQDIATKYGFNGGAAVMMDVTNGEVVAETSYPEYDSEVMSSKDNTALIKQYLTDPQKPFLNRVVDGLYTPGSIVKPYVALGGLTEGTIDPNKQILSTGSISIPNDYDPSIQTVFHDWKPLGWLDLRHGIAMSSDVYFYEVGGGYKDQKGLGITNIDKYMDLFGFGHAIQNSFFTGASGTVPSPAWKAANFDGDTWRLGDTYHTAIGQYGFQVSPIQIVRATAANATFGVLRDPSIIKGQAGPIIRQEPIPSANFQIVHEGMRLGAQIGTGVALNVPYVQVATKSGTAELGVAKDNVNSWITGFYPYTNPHYAFAIVMEHGSVHNLIGAAAVMREVMDWMNKNTPEYFQTTGY